MHAPLGMHASSPDHMTARYVRDHEREQATRACLEQTEITLREAHERLRRSREILA